MMTALLKLARPAQWLKNGIIPVSIIFAGKLGDPLRVEFAILATAYFCLLSSAVYTFNDLFDRKTDQQHPRKKSRPIASGEISVGLATGMALLLA